MITSSTTEWRVGWEQGGQLLGCTIENIILPGLKNSEEFTWLYELSNFLECSLPPRSLPDRDALAMPASPWERGYPALLPPEDFPLGTHSALRQLGDRWTLRYGGKCSYMEILRWGRTRAWRTMGVLPTTPAWWGGWSCALGNTHTDWLRLASHPMSSRRRSQMSCSEPR